MAERRTGCGRPARELLSILPGAGGTFRSIAGWDTEGMSVYEDGGEVTAVDVADTSLADYLDNEMGERLLLAFPDTGGHEEACQEFLDFIKPGKAFASTGSE